MLRDKREKPSDQSLHINVFPFICNLSPFQMDFPFCAGAYEPGLVGGREHRGTAQMQGM